MRPTLLLTARREVVVEDLIQPKTASGAEVGGIIGAHTAVVARAVHTLRQISAPFVKPDGVLLLELRRRRHGRTLLDQVRPLTGEVLEVRDVLLPRLDLGSMFARSRCVAFVEVLVRQTAEAMTELMHHHRQVPLVVRRGDEVRVVHTASAIDVAIGEDDKVLVGDADEGIVDRLHTARRQIAVGVEGIEVRGERRAGPALLTRHGDARLFGGREDHHDIEVLAVALEGLIVEERFGSCLGITEEDRHLSLGIAFGEECQVDAVTAVPRVDEVLVLLRLLRRLVTDEDILRIDTLRLINDGALLGIAQAERHLHRSLGEGDAQHLLIGAALGLRQRSLTPLEVERVEGEGIDELARGFVMDVELSIPSEDEAVEVETTASPALEQMGFVGRDLSRRLAPGEDVVQAERAVSEEGLKRLLRRGAATPHEEEQEKKR